MVSGRVGHVGLAPAVLSRVSGKAAQEEQGAETQRQWENKAVHGIWVRVSQAEGAAGVKALELPVFVLADSIKTKYAFIISWTQILARIWPQSHNFWMVLGFTYLSSEF